jgi:hypothetical protein
MRKKTSNAERRTPNAQRAKKKSRVIYKVWWGDDLMREGEDYTIDYKRGIVRILKQVPTGTRFAAKGIEKTRSRKPTIHKPYFATKRAAKKWAMNLGYPRSLLFRPFPLDRVAGKRRLIAKRAL